MARQRRSIETHPVTFKIWGEIIDPIISWCEEIRGRRTQLLEEFRKTIAPEPVSRQIFDAWLATPENRTEPNRAFLVALP